MSASSTRSSASRRRSAPRREVPLRLAALACRIEEDVERVTRRLRLTNAERDRMLAALAAKAAFRPLPAERAARASLYRLGRTRPGATGFGLAFADGAAAPERCGLEGALRPAGPLDGAALPLERPRCRRSADAFRPGRRRRAQVGRGLVDRPGFRARRAAPCAPVSSRNWPPRSSRHRQAKRTTSR